MEASSALDRAKVWTDILADIRKEIGEQRYNLWIGHTEVVHLDAERVEIGVPNLFVQEWLEGHFSDIFKRVCVRHVGGSPAVRFVITGKLFQESRKKALEAEQDILVEGARSTRPDAAGSRINEAFRLESFVVGSCNRLAYACAKELIQGGAGKFNPLFIHAASGLGKTHLLQAIWWAVGDAKDSRRVEYVAAEEFTNQFVYAMRGGKLDAFRNKYRKVDILFIDDVHFFCDKSALQEEFLHTYDVLDAENKQVVLASDVHPKMLKRLKESLASRFASGMVVRLGKPDFSTRVDILKGKAKQLRCRVSEDVLRYIARGFEGNTRELVGALLTVVGYARLTKGKITLDVAREALTELGRVSERVVDLDVIEKAVSFHFGVSQQDLHSSRRTKAVALPRQVCMYLARELTNLSCAEIAGHFGGKHHTTIVFGHRRIAELCRKDRDLGDAIAALKERIQEG